MKNSSAKRHWSVLDLSILGLSLCLLIYSGRYFLQNFMGQTESRSDVEMVGRISGLKNQVKLRAKGSYIWSAARVGIAVYDGDTVFTNEDSTAEVELEDRSVVYLEPRTMITFRKENGQMSVHLNYGVVRSNLAEASQLNVVDHQSDIGFGVDSTDGKRRSLPPAKVNLPEKEVEEEPKSPFLKTVEVLPPPSIAPTNILKKMEWSDLGRGDIKSDLVVLDRPKQIEVYWKSVPEAKKYEVEISGDPEFRKLLSRKIANERTMRFKRIYPWGLYWRVRAWSRENHPGLFSDIGRVSLRWSKPELKFELSDGQEDLDWQTGRVIWTDLRAGVRYLIQTSDSPLFKPSRLEWLDRAEYEVKARPGAKKWARVRMFRGKLPISQASDPLEIIFPLRERSLAVVEPEDPVDLLRPQKGEVFVVVGDDPLKIVFQWKTVENVKTYQLEVSMRDDFSQKFIDKVIEGGRYVHESKIDFGVYYWRVKPLSGELEFKWSPPQVFEVDRF